MRVPHALRSRARWPRPSYRRRSPALWSQAAGARSMSGAITVAVAATYDETRLLATRGRSEVLRARLASPSFAHRWTMPLLLESLALGWQQPLRVVLCAESEAL